MDRLYKLLFTYFYTKYGISLDNIRKAGNLIIPSKDLHMVIKDESGFKVYGLYPGKETNTLISVEEDTLEINMKSILTNNRINLDSLNIKGYGDEYFLAVGIENDLNFYEDKYFTNKNQNQNEK